MPIVGIARQRFDADHEIVAVGRGHTDFHAECVVFVRLALGDTFYFRRLHAVALVLVVPLLRVNPMGRVEPFGKAYPKFWPALDAALGASVEECDPNCLPMTPIPSEAG